MTDSLTDDHPTGCVYPNGICTCPEIEHNHPPDQTVSWCRTCQVEGEDALLVMADRIRAQRAMPGLVQEGYEAYGDWRWGDD